MSENEWCSEASQGTSSNNTPWVKSAQRHKSIRRCLTETDAEMCESEMLLIVNVRVTGHSFSLQLQTVVKTAQ